jgi:hypothetical protein
VQLQALLGAVDEIEWETLASRRVQHYGFRFEYKVQTPPTMPQSLHTILDKTMKLHLTSPVHSLVAHHP